MYALYLALYHGLFGLLLALIAARRNGFSLRALVFTPFVWVAIELARTYITGFPWDLLGTTQIDNIPLSRRRHGDRRVRPFLRDCAGEYRGGGGLSGAIPAPQGSCSPRHWRQPSRYMPASWCIPRRFRSRTAPRWCRPTFRYSIPATGRSTISPRPSTLWRR